MNAARLPKLAALYEEQFEFVWRSLRRLGVQAPHLEDALQDVFVVVQRQLPDFEQRSSIRTWLFGIALRVARNYRRAALKQAATVPAWDGALVGTDPDPQQAALVTEAASIVQSLLDQLDEDRRAVFVLSELEGLTANEIGDSLGIGASTVYSRLRLARRDIEQALRRLRAGADWRDP